MENEPNLTVGEVCPDASPMRHAETGDAPPVRDCLNYYLRPDPFREAREANADPIEPGSKPTGLLHLKSYNPANWFTSSGVYRKRREIERLGLPSFENWRFVTLTVDPEMFPDGPLSAYLHCKDRMRHVFTKWRAAGLMHKGGAWCWKLEFQENGWPHWHILHDFTDKYTEEQLAEVTKLWGFGRTNVERVRSDDFLYSFKYAFKPVQCLEDADLFDFDPAVAPAWFLDYVGTQTVTVKPRPASEDGSFPGDDFEPFQAEKPVSFARVRFWQTSRNFYTKGRPKPKAVEKKVQLNFTVPLPARAVADRLASTVHVVARKSCGRYVASAVLALTCATGSLWKSVAWDTFNGAAVGLAVNSFIVPATTITRNTLQKWKVQHLTEKNRLSLAKARRLAQEGNSLRTC